MGGRQLTLTREYLYTLSSISNTPLSHILPITILPLNYSSGVLPLLNKAMNQVIRLPSQITDLGVKCFLLQRYVRLCAQVGVR